MLKDALYTVVNWMAMVHDKINHLNDRFEGVLSDKQMHFLVIGILGILLLCIIHPLFKSLAKNGHVLTISFIYVFTLILVITFAIEIGQRVTKTGKMEFADIVFGIGGFLSLYAVFLLLLWVARKIRIARIHRKYGNPRRM